MAFDEVRFPVSISFGATGGPTRRTEVVSLASGFEERNATWANSRRRYDASTGVKSLNDLHDVITFWEARLGRLHGFRWKDFADWKSCRPNDAPSALDQAIGTGTGALTTFQLKKTYTSGGRSWARDIKKPVAGTVLIAVAGVVKTIGTHWTLDATTGVVTFTGGNTPANGAAVTAGFEFDVPVRFDMDELQLSHEGFGAAMAGQIPIVEVRV